jgi:hypothetical protein
MSRRRSARLVRRDKPAACSALRLYSLAVQAASGTGKPLTAAQGAELVRGATRIRSVLACALPCLGGLAERAVFARPPWYAHH